MELHFRREKGERNPIAHLHFQWNQHLVTVLGIKEIPHYTMRHHDDTDMMCSCRYCMSLKHWDTGIGTTKHCARVMTHLDNQGQKVAASIYLSLYRNCRLCWMLLELDKPLRSIIDSLYSPLSVIC